MDEFHNTNGYSFSWTQPYNVSINPFYTNYRVRDEMIRIEAVDNIVQNMLTYPDAEAILNKLMKENRHD